MSDDQKGFSYAGRILRIKLPEGELSTEQTERYAPKWLGSSGIAVKVLYDELRDWVTPYDPANRLIFGAGALIGTTAPGANKMNVSALGPMTGGWASSCSDSYLGSELKYAGYDSIIIEGKAHKPVYLLITDDRVHICDASHLWGKTTWETLDVLRKELECQELRGLAIGPAGENLVRGACIIQDKGRAHGRGGLGAVMGSKNVKAIVATGKGAIKVAQPERFRKAAKDARAMFKQLKAKEVLHRYGTLSILPRKQEVCSIPYKNFQGASFPESVLEKIDPMRMIDKYQVAFQSYPGCAIGGCSRIMYINEGPYCGLKTEICQYETLATMTGRLAVEEGTFMFKAQALCNQLGIDVDAAGPVIAWAMECYQRGIIDKNDTDGLELRWGDAGTILELIRKMCYREGFGNILAEGSFRAADIVGRGSDYYAIHIKRLDLYEVCRGSLGWSLGVTTSTRGGGHTTGAPLCETVPGLDVEKAKVVYGVKNPDKPQEYEGKAQMVKYGEILQRVNNSLGICHYNTTYWDVNQPDLEELAELYSAATGWETTVENLETIAMRQLNLEKALNLRFTDFDRKDDLPAPRELKEPIASGNLRGWKMDERKYDEMLDEYYDLHGWDKKTSYPARKTLVNLDLGGVADDLEEIGKLGQG